MIRIVINVEDDFIAGKVKVPLPKLATMDFADGSVRMFLNHAVDEMQGKEINFTVDSTEHADSSLLDRSIINILICKTVRNAQESNQGGSGQVVK